MINHFALQSYDYMMYKQLQWRTTECEVIRITYSVEARARELKLLVTPPLVNRASLKPASHDQSLDGDNTVCG